MKEQKTVTRRDFIKGVAYKAVGTAIGLTAAEQVLFGKLAVKNAWGLSSNKTRVVIIRDENVFDRNNEVDSYVVGKMLDKGIQALTGKRSARLGWQSLFQTSDKIGIKTSVNMVPTNQGLIDALRGKLEGIGISFANITTADAEAFNSFKDRNVLINMPALKTHWLSGIAGVIKNYINLTLVPSIYHSDSCASLGKVWKKPIVANKTRLNIVDATKALFHGGPQVEPRYLWSYRGLIIGEDPVAVDMVCLQLIQAKRNEYKKEFWELNPPPKHIEIADKKYKLGISDLSKIEVVKIGWEGEILL